jgi:multicomponent Na+:H+ antiporter subunit B
VNARRATRYALGGGSLTLVGALLFRAVAELPAFGDYEGRYGRILNRLVLPARHVTNAVSGIVFDVRGVDTMGEELILFTAVTGTALLLRETRDEDLERPPGRLRSGPVRLLGLPLVPVTLLLGLWTIAFGYITPGGGFQGGVVLGAALLLLWTAGSYDAYRRASPPPLVEFGEALGAGGYVVVGLAALVSELAFLEAVVGLGHPGTFASGGSIPFLNALAGLEVAGATVLLFHEFLEEYMTPVQRRDE